MAYIYSYRLTHFGGTAPCFDDNKLTLAICKRDMRRVIGNLYYNKDFNKENDEIWFLGIVGNGLAKKAGFNGYKDQIIYAAKVTDVKEFHEYFAVSDYANRADNIYEKTQETTKLKSKDVSFKHKDSIAVHKEDELQERDFDVDHPNANKYVLFSDEYCFLKPDSEEENKIINLIKNYNKWPTGVGHRWFKDKNNDLKDILKKSADKNANTFSNLPQKIRLIINKKQGCGKYGGNS